VSQTSGPASPGSGGSELSEDLLSAFVDGELDDAMRAAVDARLAESDEWRAVLDDVTAARDAIRSLPLRDAPPEFWQRILASDDPAPAQGGGAAVADLDAARTKRRSTTVRFAAFAASAAAAIVILAVALVPGHERVKPAVATFTNAHAVRSSVGNDAVSNVAGEAVPGGIGR
jgi:anti-sigma factor RsiW